MGINYTLLFGKWGLGGLMVSKGLPVALAGISALFSLGKTLYSRSASLHPGV